MAVGFVLLVWLPESPRWLIAKNKKTQLAKVLDQASRVNKTYLPIDRIIENGEKDDTSSSTDTIASATVLDLFWPPTILIRLIVLLTSILIHRNTLT